MVWFGEPEKMAVEDLSALVKDETGGELHPAIRQPGVWLDRDEREAADKRLAEARARYAQRPPDDDEPEWSDVAVLLSTPQEARYGRVSYPQAGAHYDVLAAGNNWFGLIATAEGTDVYLRTFRREYLADAVVAGLAEFVWKSGEQPIQIRRSVLQAVEDDITGFREPHPTVARVQQLMRLPTYLSCEFYAERRQGSQARRSSKTPLRVYGLGDEHYDVGCWTLTSTPHGSDRALLFAPADLEDLARRIEQVRRELD